MDKTGRGAGAGVGDQWIKPGDWELGAHVMHKMIDAIIIEHERNVLRLHVLIVKYFSYTQGMHVRKLLSP